MSQAKVEIKESKTKVKKSNKKSKSQHGIAYWSFVGPSLFAFSLVVLIPLILGIYYSFTNWNGIGSNIEWVGLKNYIKVFNDEGFRSSLWFTVKFTIVSVISINVIAFFLALLVTRESKISNLLRTIFFMPNLIGGIVLGYIWKETLDTITRKVFHHPFTYSVKDYGFWGLLIVMCWQLMGYMMIIYIAGIQNIPEDVIEAAKIDGATPFQILYKITIPLVMPSVTICLFLTLSNSFKLYDQNYALNGNSSKTSLLAMDIYKTFYGASSYAEGRGQAKAVIFFLIVACITFAQLRLTRSKEVES